MAIKLKINKDKIIPDAGEYGKVLVSTFFVVYVLKVLLFKMFPVLQQFTTPWDLVVLVFMIYYLKSIFDIKVGGNDLF